jgi:chloride channel protein, CIC family
MAVTVRGLRGAAVGPSSARRAAWTARLARSARRGHLGLVAGVVVVGVGSGLGAVAFRWLIFALTWVVTGHREFGQDGYVGSAHLARLGLGLFVVAPVVGGVIYGPLIWRFAREARGHGVPEVMIAVAENGGRIRPQVTVVKAISSAVCIATGGSVGREGPIVQIGSAFASGLGQRWRVSESRLRVLVACGAAGAISATFNAPITGVLFAFELIVREFALDALLPVLVSSVIADLVGQAFFGSGPVLSGFPHDMALPRGTDYVVVALLGLGAGAMGVGFSKALYRIEDLCDDLWRGRPEWLRPAVGGVALGLVLLALPELYGVGYPVVNRAVSGGYAAWILIGLALGKVVATSLTIGIGGSGGVFAPSLFIGAMAGSAVGDLAVHTLGHDAGNPAAYAVVAMGATFAGATRAPLTSIAAVVEMTGNFSLALPVMLGVALAAWLSGRLSYGTIYTTKLLRRGVDIDRPRLASALAGLSAGAVMQPLAPSHGPVVEEASGAYLALGEVVDRGPTQAVSVDEELDQVLRQLALYGRAGLPVVDADRRVVGWVTSRDVVRAMATRVAVRTEGASAGALAAEWADDAARRRLHEPTSALEGYDLVEVRLDSAARHRRVDGLALPAGAIVAAVTTGRSTVAARPDLEVDAGDRLWCLAPRSPSD